VSTRLSPKRPLDQTAGLAWLFPYYAGFGFEWAAAELERRIRSAEDVVLDPWNGGGTTTTAAGSLGLASVGIDMSPLATRVALSRSRLAGGPPGHDVDFRATSTVAADASDPLRRWFGSSVAGTLRGAAQGIEGGPEEVALLWTALFRSVRSMTPAVEGSNPTWVRTLAAEEQPELDDDEVLMILNGQAAAIRRQLEGADIHGFRPPQILTGDARAIPLVNSSISIVLTSPPYLTRIDYAVAYSRELALLDQDQESLDLRRRRLMGTTASRRKIEGELASPAILSAGATSLLAAVRAHPSKDSAGYYYRNFCQYLTDLSKSIQELNRVTAPCARIGIVVQDSYYKDVPVYLGEIVADEAEAQGWRCIESTSHPVRRSLTTLNSSARAYAKSEVFEHVLWFQRGEQID